MVPAADRYTHLHSLLPTAGHVEEVAMTQPDSRFPELRAELARLSGTSAQDWYPVFKARYGMQVALEQIRATHGDGAVLTQMFTCCTAVVPIMAAGLTPRYADIDADTLALSPSAVAAATDPADPDLPLRGLVIQHTFGIPGRDEAVQLARQAHDRGAVVMEDAAHCVARLTCGDDDRPLADVSFHSFGVQKSLPTHFGGAVWINPELAGRDAALDSALRAALGALPDLSHRLGAAARMYRNQARVLARLPRAVSAPARAARHPHRPIGTGCGRRRGGRSAALPADGALRVGGPHRHRRPPPPARGRHRPNPGGQPLPRSPARARRRHRPRRGTARRPIAPAALPAVASQHRRGRAAHLRHARYRGVRGKVGSATAISGSRRRGRVLRACHARQSAGDAGRLGACGGAADRARRRPRRRRRPSGPEVVAPPRLSRTRIGKESSTRAGCARFEVRRGR
ncbi:hypothetical protein BW737_011855 [Actinomyces ruminis]|uniref:DegT/DnrJ/EryC1/StrS aminotransferase family protein n=1 Tax=Actinomyces ruminis TaxID=1937003 RepID=A0ABX4MDF2_9ACTO|nr:hypothetical protein BW737_011855 [Actinomyces ruminis]